MDRAGMSNLVSDPLSYDEHLLAAIIWGFQAHMSGPVFENRCTRTHIPYQLAQGFFQSVSVSRTGVFMDFPGSLLKCLPAARIKICICIIKIPHVPPCVDFLFYQ